MKVSVIIPLYNRKDLICHTLDSLKSEFHGDINLEVIVVDDGSEDGAFELVALRYPWVRLHKNPNKGAPAARNFGLSIASYDYVHFLDSDDLVSPGFYRGRIEALDLDTSLSAAYGLWLTFKGVKDFDPNKIVPAHTIYPLRPKAQSMEHMTALLNGWYLHPSTIVFRKDAVKDIAGFEESLIVNQDVDLLFRFLVQGHTLLGISSAPSLVRAHDMERVGVVSGDIHKMETILALRMKFAKVLDEKQLLTVAFKQALGEFCIYRFAEYYTKDKVLAGKFYDLGNKLFPGYQLKAGLGLRMLAKILGNKNTIVLKKMISKS